VFDDARFGSIASFIFETADRGELIFDDSVGKAVNQELFATMTGGENWELREKSTKPCICPRRPPPRTGRFPPGGLPTY